MLMIRLVLNGEALVNNYMNITDMSIDSTLLKSMESCGYDWEYVWR